MLTIMLIGLITVFLVFTVLYFVFLLFGFFSKKAAVKLPKKIEPQEEVGADEAEIAAVMAAIYAILGPVSIKKIYKKKEKRNWVVWKKTGWRGVKGWSGNSELE
ncbi:hypothetical protein SU69_02990 [Thermosipho melanesiensis]|uniref:Uncharacterized protein n=2 Tax=Thermosipho melanesiensis TaxID=46541 RepID=A6LKK0_THEM4|nr:OadG family protein [Thermosipho melanesiensis]ABR30451.1 hypothetical protein Tmel_0584 [Thermosipho melanesiensis BI429]APT73611.1 hypothetical protein BW47_03115 [Thermosipho melanesiensis]OOC37558.1 hypothetical protein SU68_03010 [Thermosipho melanesiensis]OOC39454.1 hypothetical protein SU69_02990 [Thermosipho melanesiensis]OOC39517.1 hypothetical protein SU70_02990 [Thermosipho melanesiensis]